MRPCNFAVPKRYNRDPNASLWYKKHPLKHSNIATIAAFSSINHLLPKYASWWTRCSWRRKTQPPRLNLGFPQVDFSLQLAHIMVCSHMLDQAVYCSADRIYIPAPATDCARVLAIRSMTLDNEALGKAKLPSLHDIGFVSRRLVENGDWCSLPDHPEIFTGDVETNAACGTCAAASGGERGCQWFTGHVL